MSENKDDVLGPIRERDAKFFNFDHSRADMSWVAKRWVPEHDRRSLLAIVDSQSSTIESLRRELDAVRREAERYRWLRASQKIVIKHDCLSNEDSMSREAGGKLEQSLDVYVDYHLDRSDKFAQRMANATAAISEARGRE